MKPLSLRLAAVHDAIAAVYKPAVVAAFDALHATAADDPNNLLTPAPLVAPAVIIAPSRLEEFPPTYFRMNEMVSLVEVSPELLALLEVEQPEDLLGRKWEQYLTPEDFNRLWNQWLGAVQTKRGFEVTFSFTTPSGRQLLLRETVWPLRDQATMQFHGWFGYVQVARKVLKMDEPTRTPQSPSKQSA